MKIWRLTFFEHRSLCMRWPFKNCIFQGQKYEDLLKHCEIEPSGSKFNSCVVTVAQRGNCARKWMQFWRQGACQLTSQHHCTVSWSWDFWQYHFLKCSANIHSPGIYFIWNFLNCIFRKCSFFNVLAAKIAVRNGTWVKLHFHSQNIDSSVQDFLQSQAKGLITARAFFMIHL